MRFCPVCGVSLRNLVVFWQETRFGRLNYEYDGEISVVFSKVKPRRESIRCGKCGSNLSEPARLN